MKKRVPAAALVIAMFLFPSCGGGGGGGPSQSPDLAGCTDCEVIHPGDGSQSDTAGGDAPLPDSSWHPDSGSDAELLSDDLSDSIDTTGAADVRSDGDAVLDPDSTVTPKDWLSGLDLFETPAPDTLQDLVPCVPVCEARTCGSDGCADVCGFCAYGYTCSGQGTCLADPCKKACIAGDGSLKECGSDNCGGSCGKCATGMRCGQDGRCYESTCTKNCTGRECGDDGCGGTCGNCGLGKLCSLLGKCVNHPCGLVTAGGECVAKQEGRYCQDMQVISFTCGQGKVCGWDSKLGRFDCIDETPCVPNCAFGDGNKRECGTDGCWGNCGTCAKGWACQLGLCKPSVGAECLWIDSVMGTCFGDVRWFCASGKLYKYDCMAKEGKKCGWKAGPPGVFDCI